MAVFLRRCSHGADPSRHGFNGTRVFLFAKGGAARPPSDRSAPRRAPTCEYSWRDRWNIVDWFDVAECIRDSSHAQDCYCSVLNICGPPSVECVQAALAL